MLYFCHDAQRRLIPHMVPGNSASSIYGRAATPDQVTHATRCELWRDGSRRNAARSSAARSWLVGALTLLLGVTAGCSAGSVFGRPTATPPATRTPAPTFTLEASPIAVITATPSEAGTPGVIVVPPGVEPRDLIPIPPTPTSPPTPTATATLTATNEAPEIALPAPTGTGASTETEASATPASPLATPTTTATETATTTPTPTVEPTPTATQTPTPFVRVSAGLVNLRTGPGIDYPLVAQLGPEVPVAIVGQSPEGTWFQICCVNGDSVWVAKNHVETVNDTQNVVLVLSNDAPEPTATSTPTETPTITPTPTATPYPAQVSWGPLYFPTNNELLSIWTKIAGPEGEPLSGYYVKAQFRNREDGSSFEDRPNTKGEQPSSDRFDFNVPPGTASGNRVEYNYKYEFIAPDPAIENPATTDTRLTEIDGYWRIYVVDRTGQQLSDAIEFNTLLGNNNREVYVAWTLSP